MPGTIQIADLLFKKSLGLGTTQSGRQFFQEPIAGRPFVIPSQIWSQADLIPNTAPAVSVGVVQKLTDYQLTGVGGTTNSFTGASLKDTIPFNWGDGTSYNYTVKDTSASQIAFGVNDWVVDTDAGILMFNNGVPLNMAPTISFFRYTGVKGLLSGTEPFLDHAVTGISVTGSSSITGYINIVGIYGTNILLSGNNIIGISGGGGGGSTTNNNTYNITGFGVTGVSVSGGNSLTGLLSIIQGANIVLTQLGNTGFSIAGPLGAGEANTASNLGGAVGVWYDKSIYDLRFNSISGRTGLLASLNNNVIYIDSTVNTGQFYPSSNPSQYATSGNLQSTGQTNYNLTIGLSGKLDLTGSNLYNFEFGNATNLSGNLQTTGSNLRNLIVGLSGQLDLTGVKINTLTTNLGATGSMIIGLSGIVNNVITNLGTTGSYLYNNIVGLSGKLQETGTNLINLINGLSGQLDLTGVKINTLTTNLQSNSVNLSGNLGTTGSNLLNLINGLSGQLNLTGVAINTVSTNTQANAINLSGNLATTGTTLNDRITTLTTNLSSNSTNLSGNLQITGQTLYNNIVAFSGNVQANATNLSGNLQITGSTLNNLINGLSGQLNISGGLLSAIKVTGSNIISVANFTGVGGTNVYLSGNNLVCISGGAGGGTQDLSSYSTIANLYQTGSDLNNKILGLSGNLDTTGSNLYNLIVGVSGQLDLTGTKINTLTTNLGTTGLNARNDALNLSGNLLLTGQTSYNLIIGLSGVLNTDISNLGSTGSTLNNRINGLSGELQNTGTKLNNLINGLSGNLALTGSNLYNYLYSNATNLSGNLATTGTTLNDRITTLTTNLSSNSNNLSGNLLLTGQTSYNLVIGLSGVVNNDISNLTTTGQTLNNKIIGLSGAFDLTGSNLYSLVNTERNKQTVSGISISGGNSLTGAISITGIGGLGIIQRGNLIEISGAPAGGTSNTYNTYNTYVNSGSGLYVFQTSLETGISKKFINFPTSLDFNPTIVNTLKNEVYDTFLGTQISGTDTTGYWCVFSDTIYETGYILNTYVCNATGTGLATTIIINQIGNDTISQAGVTGVSVTGSNSITGKINIQGIYGTNIILSGDNIIGISGGGGSSDLSSYATNINLASTGQQSYNLIIGLSGQLNLTGNAINTVSTNTQANATNLSGNLQTTGSNAYINALNLSGNLLLTGQKAYNLVIGLSGVLNADITNLGTTGSVLNNLIYGLSGQLDLTGVKINTLTTNLQNNSVNLSGNLQSTGSILNNLINGLSGQLNISGGLLYLNTNPAHFAKSGDFISGISITGGTAIQGALNINQGTNITLTQIGSNSFSIASTTVGGAGGGVTGISVTGESSITGKISFTGIGGLNVLLVGQEIQFSGGGGGGLTQGQADLLYYSISNPVQFTNSGNLTSTGQTLLKLINGLSGQLDLTGVKINTVGTNCANNAINLSGNLQLTGSTINSRISSILSKSTTFYNSDGIPSGIYLIPMWRAQTACTVTGVHGYIISGSNAVIAAYKGYDINRLTAGYITVAATGTWYSSGIITNGIFAQGDILVGEINSVKDFPVSVTIQVDYII